MIGPNMQGQVRLNVHRRLREAKADQADAMLDATLGCAQGF